MELNEFTIKEKEYYCFKCKEYSMRSEINPECPECGQTMYVALRSLLDGSRITGNDELAQPDYETARRTRKS